MLCISSDGIAFHSLAPRTHHVHATDTPRTHPASDLRRTRAVRNCSSICGRSSRTSHAPINLTQTCVGSCAQVRCEPLKKSLRQSHEQIRKLCERLGEEPPQFTLGFGGAVATHGEAGQSRTRAPSAAGAPPPGVPAGGASGSGGGSIGWLDWLTG